jgi:hypothetical protein
MRFINFILILGVLFLPYPLSARDSQNSTSRVHILYNVLENCPQESTPFHQVNTLAINLVKLDTLHAYKYYRTGFHKLSPSQAIEMHTLLLAKHILDQVRKSSLSVSQKTRIFRQIVNYPPHLY